MKRLTFAEVSEPLKALVALADPEINFLSLKSIHVGKSGESHSTVLQISYFENGDNDHRKAGLITKEFYLEFPSSRDGLELQ